MPSAFATAWRRTSPDIDRRFGEPFLYQPMIAPDGGGRPVADPSRPALTIVAALTEKPAFAYPETVRGKRSVVAEEATQDMLIDLADLALPYDPRTGDRLTQVESGALYQVNGPRPDGIARTELRVFKLKAGTGT